MAGAAALSTATVSSAQTAEETPAATQAKNPYGGCRAAGSRFHPTTDPLRAW
ncbi:hypothetical protein [Rhizobium mongolense]